MGTHLLGLVLKQRVQLAVALVAPRRDENLVPIPNGHDLGLAAGQRTLDLELRCLGQQIASDVKDGRIGLGAGLASSQRGVELLAHAGHVTGRESGARPPTRWE